MPPGTGERTRTSTVRVLSALSPANWTTPAQCETWKASQPLLAIGQACCRARSSRTVVHRRIELRREPYQGSQLNRSVVDRGTGCEDRTHLRLLVRQMSSPADSPGLVDGARVELAASCSRSRRLTPRRTLGWGSGARTHNLQGQNLAPLPIGLLPSAGGGNRTLATWRMKPVDGLDHRPMRSPRQEWNLSNQLRRLVPEAIRTRSDGAPGGS